MNDFYVYAFTDPRKNDQYFYVGKGRRKRYRKHLTESKMRTDNPFKVNIINAIRAEGLEPGIVLIQENLSEAEALELEEETIKKYGRKGREENGILSNICLGGLGGGVGKSEILLEERIKIAITAAETFLKRVGEISENNLDNYFIKILEYFSKAKSDRLPRTKEIIDIARLQINERKKNIELGIKLPRANCISQERREELSNAQREYHLLNPRPKKEQLPPPRLKEQRYILTNTETNEIFKLGSRDLTDFCEKNNIHRGKLKYSEKRNTSYLNWKLEREDCDQNKNNPPRKRTKEEQEAISAKLRNKIWTDEQKSKLKPQHYYKVTDPKGKEYILGSPKLQEFCKTFKLCYTSLMTSKNQKRLYKGWSIVEINPPK